MRLQIPWWLNPWHEARGLRDVNELLIERGNNKQRQIGVLTGQRDSLRSQLAEAERQNRNLMGAQTPEGAISSSEQPDFVLVGIPRGTGVRLLAARDLAGTHFGMTDMNDPPPRWKIMATLVQPLFIDDVGYTPAMARLQEIWANWDREEAQRRRPQLPGRSSSRGRAAGLPAGPGMLTAGGDDNADGE